MRAATLVALIFTAPLIANAAPTATPSVNGPPEFTDCKSGCPTMVVIPGGSFLMGSPADEPGRYKDEGPQHSVQVHAFAAGKFPVTRREWALFVKETAYTQGSNAWCDEATPVDRHFKDYRQTADTEPAVCITWEGAEAYADWLSSRTGHHYRLLTEAEYEYASRAGTTTPYPFASFTITRNANGGAANDGPDDSDGYRYTAPVGSYPANIFGLYDMLGNVWEWTEDCYHSSYKGAPKNGSAWTTGNCDNRVLRGGSWYTSSKQLRSATRAWFSPASRYFIDVGFRVARTDI